MTTANGKTALITGAGRGIGKAISQSLGRSGFHVIVAARSRSEIEQLVSEIESADGTSEAIEVDLSVRSAVHEFIEKLRDKKVDVLVNNAGVGSSQNPKPLVDFDDEFWDLTMALNVTAPYLLTKSVLPNMVESGFGRIINISSINAKVPALHGAAYTASKHAIAGLTKSTALEVAGSGVTANAICPGVTATVMNDLRVEYDAARLEKDFSEVEKTASPYGRRLTPEEISPLAAFLASEGSAAINGQLLNVCGGTVMA
ncbi:SDR family oxidoreductase [Pirellulaceae bacterium]|jgi:gluconate 5-dehydrogenase|nr:SDR family oxidoreductase [Pirellulaceae bacterium]